MKFNFIMRILASILCVAVLFTAMPITSVFGANVAETNGIQLQTILVDNDGKNSWMTESWQGANILPNTSWTTSDITEYYANGYLNFKVRNTKSGNSYFMVGLRSKCHGETVSIYWTDLEKYKSKFLADSSWRSYSLSIKELVDAFPDSGFALDCLWVIAISGASNGGVLEFKDVTITSTDDERQYPFIKVNQVGYATNGQKTARISYFEKFGSLNGKTFEIVNKDTEQVAYSGTIPTGKLDKKFSGEMVHIINFDDLATPGTYYVRVKNTGFNSSVRSP